jgi:hypothetical protein
MSLAKDGELAIAMKLYRDTSFLLDAETTLIAGRLEKYQEHSYPNNVRLMIYQPNGSQKWHIQAMEFFVDRDDHKIARFLADTPLTNNALHRAEFFRELWSALGTLPSEVAKSFRSSS